jgi:hypothetical protein
MLAVDRIRSNSSIVRDYCVREFCATLLDAVEHG